MKIFKALILTLALSFSALSSGIGFKAQFVANDVGPGFGAGFLGMIDVADYFMLYPNIDFWYSTDNHHDNDRYWDHDHWIYYDSWDYHAYEVAFDMDGAFIFPRPVQTFFGFGIAPVITVEDWSENYPYYYDDDADVGVGFNMFGGILFPMGNNSGLFEIRGKIGHEFSVFKMAFGIVFGSGKHYYRR
jgi:hypothetical protein